MEEMKAFVRTSPEDNDVELTEVPIPTVGEGEVLIMVQAFGVGVHDRYFIPGDAKFPYPIGTEGSGIIKEIGSGVDNLQIGDRVMVSNSMQIKGGCWAQYVAIPSGNVIPIPAEIHFTHAAALPVAGKTAVESMRALNLKKGETLFAAGASGAIGTLVIQLAKDQGIRVIGSASSKNHEHMQSLGAEETVDYSDSDWKNSVKEWAPDGVDAALAIQPGTGADSMDVVKDGGKVIIVSGDRVDAERDITVEQLQHKLDFQYAMAMIVEGILAGKMHPAIEYVYPFDQALEALKKTETRHARGKLVVSMTR